MGIDVKSFESSVASLDADLIDLEATEELEDAAFVAASNICANKRLDLNELVDLLKRCHSGSDGNEFALLLTNATRVDWLHDERTEATLRLVVEWLLQGIAFYSEQRG
jgi:hypothetical protein